MIIIEGPDASGKSTLARYIAHALDLDVQSSEGPPRYPGDIVDRIARYDQLTPTPIFDRHPVVSEEVYAYALRRPSELTPAIMQQFYKSRPIFIYCDPLTSERPPTHVVKDHDDPTHLYALHENYERLVNAYRSWAFSHAHLIYRVGDDPDRIVHYLTDLCRDISDFHNRFAIAYHGPPRHLPQDLRDFRIKFIAEELCEYAGVPDITKRLIQSALHEQQQPQPLADEFDALIDLAYVVLGTAHLHGFPFAKGWARVHRCNMLKTRALNATDSPRQSTHDVIKPEGWRPADLTGLVA